MAFTKTPASQTYDTKRINFVVNPEHRSGNLLDKDAKLENMLVEFYGSPDKTNARTFVKSRPGLSAAYNQTAGVGRGVYYWVYNKVGYVIYAIGNKVYSNNTLVQTLTTSTGEVGFTEFVNSVGAVTLIMLDGTKGYVFTNPSAAPTLISDADFPTPHIPMPIFLDGYVFVAKDNSQDIYNCDLDDPLVWSAGNYVSAEMYPDKIIALSKNNNFLYAVGNTSVEYFYDAANATGSPLLRNASAVQQFGTISPASVVATDTEVIMLGETTNGGHTVWTIDGFKAKEIGNAAVRSILRAEGSNLQNALGHVVRCASQKLYVVTLTSISLVYSFDTEMWFEWTSGVNGELPFIGSHGTDGPNSKPYVQGFSDGKVYLMSEEYHTDDGTVFVCEIVTPIMDFDTFNRKTMSRLNILGDTPATGTDNNVSIEWSDDDYTTWSTPRTLSFNYNFPSITQLGNFRRRAFRIKYNKPFLFRLEAMEVDINKGAQ